MAIDKRQARAIIRKGIKRVPEGEEIRHLNIMPMMDIMTILLVAFIFQAAVGAAAITAGSVDLPSSRSPEELPEGASIIVITPEAIVVEEKEIVAVRNGDVDPRMKEKGFVGTKIPSLTRFLGDLREYDLEELRAKGKAEPEHWDLMIIADETIPYRLLLQVLVSASDPDAGFNRFRLIVMSEDEDAVPAM